jgi:hypothetical protein
MRHTGPAISAFNAWTMLKGLETPAVRVNHSNASAQRVAEFLQAHAAVEWVKYPFLDSHPQYELAKRQMRGGGTVVTFALAAADGAGKQRAFEVLDKLQVIDISNNLGEVALPFLAILKQDMLPDQTLSVDIDLSSPTLARKRQEVSPAYKRGAYTKIVDTNYADPWFSGSARLADATVLRWRVVDRIIMSKRTKRNARGKYKMSTRHAKRSLVTVAVALRRKSYAIAAPERPAQAKVAVAAGAKCNTLRLVRKIKSKSLDPLSPDVLINLVSDAYRRAVPVARNAA